MAVPEEAIKAAYEYAERRYLNVTLFELKGILNAASSFIEKQTLRDAANDIAYKNFEAWLLERANRIDGGTS